MLNDLAQDTPPRSPLVKTNVD